MQNFPALLISSYGPGLFISHSYIIKAEVLNQRQAVCYILYLAYSRQYFAAI